MTPPKSQTAPPHADDRDVLVFQLVGHKHWKIYGEVPIPYPYTNEQVGKDSMEVPSAVLNGPLVFDDCLHPGDVMYLPRGFVHQAQSTDDSLSFHITVAIATHDWTLGGNLSRLIQQQLMMIPSTTDDIHIFFFDDHYFPSNNRILQQLILQYNNISILSWIVFEGRLHRRCF